MFSIPTTTGRGICVVLTFAAVAAHAQQSAPDAGTLLRQQPRPDPVVPSPAPSLAPQKPDLGKYIRGPRFLVREFRFSGATLVSVSELQARVEHYRGQEITFGMLQLIAQELTGYYLDKGFVARVIIPEQEVRDGVVAIQIVEGVRGKLLLENRGQRVDGGRVVAFIDQRLPQSVPFSMARLEEAVAILNEQSGVIVGTSLTTGAREGEVDVAVIAEEKPLLSGAVGVNNGGSRGSGITQLQGGLTLSNPTGHFDATSLLFNASEGNAYVRAEYALAVGNRGLRLGVNAAHLRYRIVQNDLKPLDLHGSASTYGVTWSYPLLRTRTLSMSLLGSYDVKKLLDKSVAGETGHREVKAVNVGVAGSLGHRIGTFPSLSSASASLHFGESDEHNAGAQAFDRAGRRANGSFSKFSYGLANQGEFDRDWSYTVALRGQFARDNLDSTERMSLGGLSGVRAYPIGEASGDEGWLLNINLRRTFGDTLAATFFYDAGGIKLNKRTWANWDVGNPDLRNRYTLAGVGAALDWKFSPYGVFSATVAVPVGSNPGRDINDHNTDGRGNRARLWLSLTAQF